MAHRRAAVGFDPDHFARQAAGGRELAPAEAFRQAYETNLWGGRESPSGSGSSLDQTARLQAALPEICRRHGIRTLLDLPCGDGHWMSTVDITGIRYIGADLLPDVVARAAARRPDREFRVLDLTTSDLPAADLVLCRDCLVHLSYQDIARALENIRRSGIPFLLTTTFPDEAEQRDIRTGDWRPINLQREPFGFPAPVELFTEGCTEQDGLFADKSLGLWRVALLER